MIFSWKQVINSNFTHHTWNNLFWRISRLLKEMLFLYMLHEIVWALCLEISQLLWFLFHKDRLFFYIPAAIFSRMLRKNSQVDIIFIRHGHCSQSELTQQKSVYSRAYMLEDTHFYCCRCLRHRMTMPSVSYERPASDNFCACKKWHCRYKKNKRSL